MRKQTPVVAVYQLLGGQPPHFLHEAALDLPHVDGRVQRAASVVEDVHPVDVHLAGLDVDSHLAARGAPVKYRKGRPLAVSRSQVILGVAQ